MPRHPPPISRRTLLKAALTTGAALPAATVAMQMLSVRARAGPAPSLPPQPAHGATMVLLEAVADRLLPQGGRGPGAKDIHAATYIHRTLDQPWNDPQEAVWVRAQLARLDQQAVTELGKPFASLNATQRDEALRQWQQQEGDELLTVLLTYIMEALLGDPVYGGNPNGSAWKWLQHDPGFPLPTVAFEGAE